MAVNSASAGDTLSVQEARVRVQAPSPEDRAASSVTTIQLDGRQDRSRELADVLAESPGLAVQRSGGLGSRSLVSIRGLAADNVRVYVDGILLNDQLGGGADISGIPVDMIESVDVYRGVVPAEFGGSGVAGAVHIKTLETSRKSSGGSLRFIAGSNTTYGVHFRHHGHVRSARLLAAVTAEGSRNDFKYYRPGESIYLNPEPVLTDRTNNGYHTVALLLHARGKAGRTGVNAKQHVRLFTKGEPGYISGNATEAAAASGVESRTECELERRRWPHTRLRSSLRVFNSLAVNRFLDTLSYRDMDGDRASGAELYYEKTDMRLSTAVTGGRLTLRGTLGTSYKGALFCGYRYAAFTRSDALNPAQDHIRPLFRHTGTVGQSNDVLMFGNALLLNGTLNATFINAGLLEEDLYEITDTRIRVREAFPGFSVSAKFVPIPAVTFRANAARYFRIPSALELFGTTGSFIGQPDLKPEQGYTGDAGVRITLGQSAGGATFFFTYLNDMILYLYNTENFARPANIGAARIYGVEGTWKSRPMPFAAVSGNLTWQIPENRSKIFTSTDNPDGEVYGKLLPFRPQWQLFNRLTLTWRTFELFHEYRYTGRNYTDILNKDEWDARHLHTVGAGFSVPRYGLRTAVEARNLLNRYTYDLRGYPLPGFQLFGTVTFGWHGKVDRKSIL